MSVYRTYIGQFLIAITALMLPGCSKHSQEQIPQASFYYWRSSFELSPEEKTMVDSLRVRKIYLKFFDVDWNPISQSPQPLAITRILSSLPDSIAVIPTIFITNRTFEHVKNIESEKLAQKIMIKMFSLLPSRLRTGVTEIQMDCDWSSRTRREYFHFLNVMSEFLQDSGIALSATIRLHQYADPAKTGIPPVKRGVLMFYNMGAMEGPEASNSILDVKIGEQYLNLADSYPMHLDIALPLFHWGVLIRRGRVVNLLDNVQAEELEDTTFFWKIEHNTYRARKGHYICGAYMYENDYIRLESISLDQLFDAMRVLKRHFQGSRPSFIFFHLEPTLETRYGPSNIRSLLRSFADS